MYRKTVAKFIMAILLVIAIAVSNAPNAAWGADDATGTGTATVFVPISIAPINPLAFGFFSPGNNGGTITVKPDGLSPPTLTNTVVIVTPPINSQGRGSFRIMGAVGKSYSVIGDDEITMNALDGVPPGKIGTMQADLVYWAQSTFNQGDTSTSGVLSVQAGGFTGDILGVGGTLTVPANVASGSWLGQFQVTAQYD
jgi:Mat/Ecp fimbriae major subunit